jgi:hypothetical protein
VEKAPRSEVSASLRDLNSGSKQLPWTEVILLATSASGQSAVTIGSGVVCSRGANGCFGRGIPKRVIAVNPVNKRLGGGVVGRRASGIARRSMARNAGGNKAGGIESGSAKDQRHQLTRTRRARASAQHLGAKILRRGPAIGQVATSFSRFPMNIRASVFAVWRVAWRYVACWIAKRAIGRGGVGGAESG